MNEKEKLAAFRALQQAYGEPKVPAKQAVKLLRRAERCKGGTRDARNKTSYC